MSVKEFIVDYIRSGETKGQNLGLEVEHFVVNDKGFPIGLEEVTGLIKEIAAKINTELIYMDGYPVGYYVPGYSVTLRLVKEPLNSCASAKISELLSNGFSCRGMFAHVRRATS